MKLTTKLGSRELEISKLEKIGSVDEKNICIHFDSDIADSRTSSRMVFLTSGEAKKVSEFLGSQTKTPFWNYLKNLFKSN